MNSTISPILPRTTPRAPAPMPWAVAPTTPSCAAPALPTIRLPWPSNTTSIGPGILPAPILILHPCITMPGPSSRPVFIWLMLPSGAQIRRSPILGNHRHARRHLKDIVVRSHRWLLGHPSPPQAQAQRTSPPAAHPKTPWIETYAPLPLKSANAPFLHPKSHRGFGDIRCIRLIKARFHNYTLGCPPAQDSSHQEDVYIF